MKQQRARDKIIGEALTILLEGSELLSLYRTINGVTHQTITGNVGLYDLKLWVPLADLAAHIFQAP